MTELRYYFALDDVSPFEKWFEALDAQAAAKVSVALIRLESGNFSNLKSLGAGVSEFKINWGPGYRVYLGRDGELFIVLLIGGTKKRQDKDIANAKLYWQDYKRRKKV